MPPPTVVRPLLTNAVTKAGSMETWHARYMPVDRAVAMFRLPLPELPATVAHMSAGCRWEKKHPRPLEFTANEKKPLPVVTWDPELNRMAKELALPSRLPGSLRHRLLPFCNRTVPLFDRRLLGMLHLIPLFPMARLPPPLETLPFPLPVLLKLQDVMRPVLARFLLPLVVTVAIGFEVSFVTTIGSVVTVVIAPPYPFTHPLLPNGGGGRAGRRAAKRAHREIMPAGSFLAYSRWIEGSRVDQVRLASVFVLDL